MKYFDYFRNREYREQMKRIRRFLFDFNRVYFYTYFTGILVSFAVNTISLPLSVYSVKNITALFLLISSFGAFGISALLESARREWESAGCPEDTVAIRKYIEKGKRKKFLWLFFVIIFFGPILFIIYFV